MDSNKCYVCGKEMEESERDVCKNCIDNVLRVDSEIVNEK